MSRYIAFFTAFLLANWLVATSRADDTRHEHHHDMHQGHTLAPTYVRSVHRYPIPAITVIDQDGETTSAARLLEQDGPILVNVIFTSCTNVCPIMTATFAEARKVIGDESGRLTMLSITNDPAHDTPQVLKAYARAHRAPDGWRFITGDERSITRLLRAFDAYRGGKMNHVPLTFLRAGRNQPWIRLEGLASAQQLVNEYRKVAY